MSLEESIKQWVSIDNKIKEHNDHLKTLRQERASVSNTVYQIVNEKNLNDATIQISDGKLRFASVKVTAPITIKHVKQCLSNCISNEDDVDKIMNHIKNTRESKYVDDIKRSYN